MVEGTLVEEGPARLDYLLSGLTGALKKRGDLCNSPLLLLPATGRLAPHGGWRNQ